MKHKNIKPRKYRKKEELYKVNQYISASKVRLVGENIQTGLYTLQQALKIARDAEKDLVEIAPTATPPVCKVIDYTKFKYEQKKKQKQLNNSAQKTAIKEIRLTPTTDKHDIEFKIKHAKKFLANGAKVEAYIQFRGRAGYTMRDAGEEKLKYIIEELVDYGKPEGTIARKGSKSIIMIIPHPKK